MTLTYTYTSTTRDALLTVLEALVEQPARWSTPLTIDQIQALAVTAMERMMEEEGADDFTLRPLRPLRRFA